MSQEYDVVGFGALLCDEINRVDPQAPIPHRGYDGTESTIFISLEKVASAGGSAANTIYGDAKLGLRAAFIGAVGRDRQADIVLASFREVGVDETGIVCYPDTPTGTIHCVSGGGDGRLMTVTDGANHRYSGADLEQALGNIFRFARLVHLASFANPDQLALQNQLMGRLPEGTLVSCAPGTLYASLGISAIEPILARANHAVFNDSEITSLMNTEDHEAAAIEYSHLFPNCESVVVTLGEGIIINGKKVTSRVFVRDKPPHNTEEPSGPLKIVDTTGAGDAFTAGYLYGVLTGADYPEAARYGQAVARLSLGGIGARTNLPTRQQLEAALA